MFYRKFSRVFCYEVERWNECLDKAIRSLAPYFEIPGIPLKFFVEFPNFSVNNLRELKTTSFPHLSVFRLAEINKMAQEFPQDPLKYASVDFLPS